MKKTIAILLSLVMILSCVSIVSASAAATASITVAGKTQLVNVGDTLTYTINLKTVNPIVNGQFYLHYPQSVLEIQEAHFPVVGDDTMMFNYNEESVDCLSFNFSTGINRVDFTNGGKLAVITFKVLSAGTAEFVLVKEAMSSLNDVILVDELPTAVFTEALTGSTYVPPTVINSVKAKSAKIYVKDTTTVTAKVDNPVGATTFTSSDTKVATVDKKTGKVTAKSAGTVTIKATNNKVSKSVKITVIQKDQPMKVSAVTKSVKAADVKKKAVAVTPFKFTTKAQGTVTHKKASGSANLTVNKTTGKVTVKKGTKKGTYTAKITFTAAGNTIYKSGKQTVKVTVKVK